MFYGTKKMYLRKCINVQYESTATRKSIFKVLLLYLIICYTRNVRIIVPVLVCNRKIIERVSSSEL